MPTKPVAQGVILTRELSLADFKVCPKLSIASRTTVAVIIFVSEAIYQLSVSRFPNNS